MTSNEMLGFLSSILFAHAGTFIVFVIAPISACLILDGVAACLRGNGLNPLVFAVSLTGSLVIAGSMIRAYGVSGLEGTATYATDISALDRNALLYLAFSVPLGLLAALIRIMRGLRSRQPV